MDEGDGNPRGDNVAKNYKSVKHFKIFLNINKIKDNQLILHISMAVHCFQKLDLINKFHGWKQLKLKKLKQNLAPIDQITYGQGAGDNYLIHNFKIKNSIFNSIQFNILIVKHNEWSEHSEWYMGAWLSYTLHMIYPCNSLLFNVQVNLIIHWHLIEGLHRLCLLPDSIKFLNKICVNLIHLNE